MVGIHQQRQHGALGRLQPLGQRRQARVEALGGEVLLAPDTGVADGAVALVADPLGAQPSPDLDTVLSANESRLAQARASERNASSSYERTRALWENAGASKQDLDAALAATEADLIRFRDALGERFDWIRVAERTLNTYRSVLQGDPSLRGPVAGSTHDVD